ncbi:hypothetical protein FACS1894105_06220 [Clostridia bacterium]|nr:hypothetical protein FACS1894105_06220 [Clostridia bacterium]
MNNIKVLRAEKNLSQDELAKQVHVHQTAVSQWENGKTNPDMQQAESLAKYFDVSLDYLLGLSTERSMSYIASNISDSPFVQGSGHMVVQGERKLSVEETELLRIYGILGVKERHNLIDYAFKLEQGGQQ